MLLNIAQQTFESYQKLRQTVFNMEIKHFLTAEEIDEKLGYITDSVIYRIMYYFDIVDYEDCEVDYYGIISDCIQDDDSFDYLLKLLEIEVK